MDKIVCYQCKKETRKFADIFSCSHSVCPKCLCRLFINDNFESINNITFGKSSDNFKYTCICQKGGNQINLVFYMSVLNDLIKKKIPTDCFKHPGKIGTIFCPYCLIWFCDDCFQESDCSEHLEPGELTSRCQNHNFNPLDTFCHDCKISICKVCKELLHKTHKTTFYSKENQNKKLRSLPFKNYNEVKQQIDSLYSKAYKNYQMIFNSKIKFYDDLIEKIEAHKNEYIKEMKGKISKIQQIVQIIKLTYENLYLDTECDLEQLLNIKKYMNNFIHNISITQEEDKDMDYINSKVNLYIPGNTTFKYQFQFKKAKVKCKLTSTMTSKIRAMISLNKYDIALSSGPNIQLYNCKTKIYSNFQSAGHKENVTCLLLINSNYLASGSNDKTIKIWDLFTLKEINSLNGHQKEITALCLIKPGFIASTGFEGVIKIWNINDFTEKIQLSNLDKKKINTLVYLPNGSIASGGESETINLWDYESMGEECVLYGHLNDVTQLILLKDQRIASSSLDKTIKIWKNQVCQLTLSGHGNGVLCLFELTDGRIASGSIDRSCHIWNLLTEQSECELTGHSDNVTSIIQIPWMKPNKKKDYLILTASLDNSFKIWK